LRLKKEKRSKIQILLQFEVSHNFRITRRTRNFCSLLNCLKDGSRNNKKFLSSSPSISYISFSVAKSAVVTSRGKFRFASFFEHFEAVPFLVLTNCSLLSHPHFFEYLIYFAFRGLEGELEKITVGRNRDIYDFSCFSLQISHFLCISLHLETGPHILPPC